MSPPFSSLAYDRGTRWDRRHQTYDDLGMDYDLPSYVDLRDKLDDAGIEIYNQGSLESCTANALCTAWRYAQHQVDPGFDPSRLFLYYNERLVRGQQNQDRGARITDGCRSLGTYGLCSEDAWSYDTRNTNVKPPEDCYDEAQDHKIHTPAQLSNNNIDELKDSLAQGKPFIVGIGLYAGFKDEEAKETGNIPLPEQGEKRLDNHAILVVGYDDDNEQWICRNSWGEDWGDRGHFYLPYDYLTTEEHLSSDFWNLATDWNED